MLAVDERPRTFDEVRGQEFIVNSIRYQSINDSLFPVMILAGKYGTGKTTVAKIVAMSANCNHKVNGNPCLQCDSCKSILNQSNPDVVEIDGASNNGVDHARKIRSDSEYKPIGNKKVYIIDECHKLSSSAWDALLKTFEEPSQHVLFILCTTEESAIPQTIRSRAPIYRFGTMSFEELEKRAKEVIKKYGYKITNDAVELLVTYADGSMRNILTLVEQMSQFDKEIDEDMIKMILGVNGINITFDFVYSLAKNDIKQVSYICDTLYKKGSSVALFIKDIQKVVTDLMMYKMGANVSNKGETYMAELETVSKMSTLTNLHFAMNVINGFKPNTIHDFNELLISTVSRMKLLEDKFTEGTDTDRAVKILNQAEEIPFEEAANVPWEETLPVAANNDSEADGFALPEIEDFCDSDIDSGKSDNIEDVLPGLNLPGVEESLEKLEEENGLSFNQMEDGFSLPGLDEESSLSLTKHEDDKEEQIEGFVLPGLDFSDDTLAMDEQKEVSLPGLDLTEMVESTLKKKEDENLVLPGLDIEACDKEDGEVLTSLTDLLNLTVSEETVSLPGLEESGKISEDSSLDEEKKNDYDDITDAVINEAFKSMKESALATKNSEVKPRKNPMSLIKNVSLNLKKAVLGSNQQVEVQENVHESKYEPENIADMITGTKITDTHIAMAEKELASIQKNDELFSNILRQCVQTPISGKGIRIECSLDAYYEYIVKCIDGTCCLSVSYEG